MEEDGETKDNFTDVVEIVQTTPPPKPKPNTQVVGSDGTVITLEVTDMKTK